MLEGSGAPGRAGDHQQLNFPQKYKTKQKKATNMIFFFLHLSPLQPVDLWGVFLAEDGGSVRQCVINLHVWGCGTILKQHTPPPHKDERIHKGETSTIDCGCSDNKAGANGRNAGARPLQCIKKMLLFFSLSHASCVTAAGGVQLRLCRRRRPGGGGEMK